MIKRFACENYNGNSSPNTNRTEARRLLFGASILAIVATALIGGGFALLGALFGYPDIIREGVDVMLTSLHKNSNTVPFLYYGIGIGGILVVFFSVLLNRIVAIHCKKNKWAEMGKISGIICGVLLFTGIQRYVLLFPYLGQLHANGEANPETLEVVFESFQRYVGMSVTEHSMFVFLSMVGTFFSIAFLQEKFLTKAVSWFGILSSAVLFYGAFENLGLPGAFEVNIFASKLLIVWMLWVGIELLLKTRDSRMTKNTLIAAAGEISYEKRA